MPGGARLLVVARPGAGRRAGRMTAVRCLSPGTVPVLLLAALCGPGAGEGFADRNVLRGGGQIRGKVVADPRHPDRVTIVTETGKTPLTFQKSQVLQVIAGPGVRGGA